MKPTKTYNSVLEMTEDLGPKKLHKELKKLIDQRQKYIIWELISPYDGYAQYHLNTWLGVVEKVKSLVPKRHMNLFHKWEKGKIPKIEVRGTRFGGSSELELQLFVTSDCLNAPLNDNEK